MSAESTPGRTPPRPGSLRLTGPAAEEARAARLIPPLGATFTSDAPTWVVALGPGEATDLDAVARALPDPDSLPAGTLLFVLPNVIERPSLASRLLAAFGRDRTVSRELRSTALVARGYVRIAAGMDPESESDLVWGYAATTSQGPIEP